MLDFDKEFRAITYQRQAASAYRTSLVCVTKQTKIALQERARLNYEWARSLLNITEETTK